MSDSEDSDRPVWRYFYPATALTAIGTLGVALLVLLIYGGPVAAGLLLALGWFVATPAVALLETMSLVGWSPLSGDGSESTGPDPVADLRDRYVAGELTEAEFERELERRLGEAGDGGRADTAAKSDRELDR